MGYNTRTEPNRRNPTMTTTLEMHQAALRYALSDPSDPFAYARAKAHLRNGVASYANLDGKSAYYDAEEVVDHGKVVYRNVVRP
jgi:hypothetical protein